MVDSQEFRDIIGDATTSGSLASYMSVHIIEKKLLMMQIVNAQAEVRLLQKQDLIINSIMLLQLMKEEILELITLIQLKELVQIKQINAT